MINDNGNQKIKKLQLRKGFVLGSIILLVFFGLSIIILKWLISSRYSYEIVNIMVGTFFTSLIFSGPYIFLVDARWYEKKLFGIVNCQLSGKNIKKLIVLHIAVAVLSVPVYLVSALIVFKFGFPEKFISVMLAWAASWLILMFLIVNEIIWLRKQSNKI